MKKSMMINSEGNVTICEVKKMKWCKIEGSAKVKQTVISILFKLKQFLYYFW